ncbi:MAG: hypothetical protein AAF141_11525 [Pseudomonadota bacterium]
MMKTVSSIVIAMTIALPMSAAHAANCNAVAQSVAAQQDAQVISAKLSNKGGQDVCEVVLLKSSDDGPRKRVTMVVPAS